MKISAAERAANYAILIAFATFALYPLITVFIAALSVERGAPGGFGNFALAFEMGRFGDYLLNSLAVSLFVVTVATILSILAGYAFGSMRFPGSTVLFYVFLLGIMLPTEVIVVPLFFDLRALGLTDTFWAVALPQVAQSVAFGTYWLRAYFRSSSRALVEAARLDGAGHFRVLFSVLLPLARPAVVTLVLLLFMWTWNEFLIPLVMLPSNADLRTAPLGLGFFQGQYTQGFALLAAGAVIVALPVIIVYLFLQRHFIAGMLEGAVRE
ncbi:MAG: carbohydrate ABC transporter permease [Mobilicoccus sp.]|nr:carbohydrate ABC transporter permease [Mobilicoccus sp.]